MKAGRFKDEIVPVTIKGRKGDIVVDTDEFIQGRRHARGAGEAAPGLRQGRHGHGRQRLGHQRRRRGAGADDAPRRPRSAASTPLARIVSWATAGVDPAIMGTGPIPAVAQGARRRPAGRSTTST